LTSFMPKIMTKKKTKLYKNPTLISLLIQGCEVKFPSGYSIRISREQKKAFHIHGTTNLFDNIMYRIADVNNKLEVKHALDIIQKNRKDWERKESRNIKKIKTDESSKN
jgi:hypothetical protein